jgi:hypothetical protein
MVAAVGIGPGGWVLIILILAWAAFIVVRRVRARRSNGGDE